MNDNQSESPSPLAVPQLRQALPSDAAAIHALLRPFVMQRLLLSRTHAELIELTRHGFIAMINETPEEGTPPGDAPGNEASSDETAPEEPAQRCVGFSAVEVYSPKLAELQCLAVHPDFQRFGVGKRLVQMCVDRARDLGIMEIMAISSSDRFLENCGFHYSLPDQKRALFQQLRPRPYEDRS
ncbi:acetyltransferase [Stieleria maiorica]|uniref:Acetyltransferase n=1 Tax=Stieleria maiorica TaxID=2795974 RepID=A0A5B9MHP1_9BACT|nr:GNAT family N-acetyltransferase [Stieleria maiorica]QEG00812.1 acetyltransferase [Stieleria maiorica]